MSQSEIINMMKDEATAPRYAIVPEPEVTEILAQQQRENWSLRYHRFADVTRVLDPDGLPLGGLWVIDGTAEASEFLNAFEKAVSYINDPQNAKVVSTIVADGFRKYFNAFPDLGSHEWSDMLTRGNVTFRYMEASAVKNELRKLWHQFGIAPEQKIFYVAGEKH